VIYVWVDALANYLTGVGYPDDGRTFERYWPAALHLVGKEIIRFHCLYWPALLLAAGLPLPQRVFAHGWLTQAGNKISKSTGNVVDPRALAADFGPDAVRYFFLRAIPFGQDGDFTRAAILARYNADLANDFGNLVQRATTLASRHPLVAPDASAAGPAEHHLRERAAQLSERVSEAFETLALHEAAAAVGSFVSDVNRYIDATAPWTLARDGDTRRLSVALAHVVESTRLAAWHYAPIIPRAATEAHCRLAGTPPAPGGDVFDPTRPGAVSVGPPLFPRLAQ
jgi:methionyl-tRNA synthetase